ncbi:MAG TPA: tetratricopeptide repeat protein [Candidatus Fimivivens sp.]|nr:tetratricopeptide repeat protein [Candidatus Fimivivens sp.]
MAKRPVDLAQKNQVVVAKEDGHDEERPDVALVVTGVNRRPSLLEKVRFVNEDGKAIQTPPVPNPFFVAWIIILLILVTFDVLRHATLVEYLGNRSYYLYCSILTGVTAVTILGRFKKFVEWAAISSVFLIVILSYFQLREDVLEVTIRPVPEDFSKESRITKESMENDIVGKINEIRGFAATDKTVSDQWTQTADEQGASVGAMVASHAVVGSGAGKRTKSVSKGQTYDPDSATPVRVVEQRDQNYDFVTTLNSEDTSKKAIDLQISNVGISLQTLLKSLKRQDWVRDIFGYKLTTATGDVVWSAEDKRWILVLRYSDMTDRSYPVQKIPWSDTATSTFGERIWEAFDPVTTLSYYNNLGRNADVDRLCDALIARSEYLDKAYHFKGEVAYRGQRYADALSYSERVMASVTDPEPINDLYLIAKARDLRALNRDDESMTVLDEVLGGEPNNARALYDKASLLLKMGLFQESLDTLSRLKAANKEARRANDFSYYGLMGYASYALGNADEALRAYDEVIRLNPKNDWPYHLKGFILERMTDKPDRRLEALRLYDTALSIDPKYLTYYEDKRRLLTSLGRMDEVETLLKKALDTYADTSDAYSQLQRGRIYGIFGKTDLAIAAYEESVRLSPKYAAPMYYEGLLRKEDLNQPEKSKPLFEKAIAGEPDNLSYRMQLGYALNLMKRYDDAMRVFDDILSRDPLYAEAYHGKANALSGKNDDEGALAAREEALSISKGDAFYHYWQGDLLEKMEDDERAFEEYEKAGELGRWNKSGPYYNFYAASFGEDMGQCFCSDKKDRVMSYCEQALDSYERAIELDPKYSSALARKASLLNDLGRDNDKALLYAQRAIDASPEYAFAYAAKGYALFDLEDRKPEALEAFRDSIRLDSKQFSPYYWIARIKALQGDAEGSVALLRKSFALNSDTKELARDESDFDSIREDPAFIRFVR